MLNEQDLKTLNVRLNKQEYKDIALRMFTLSLLASTSITAPEIQRCLMAIENYLDTDIEEKVKVVKQDGAE